MSKNINALWWWEAEDSRNDTGSEWIFQQAVRESKRATTDYRVVIGTNSRHKHWDSSRDCEQP